MRYILLLRGINVGGNHKVSMTEFKRRLSDLGYTKVVSYINSGNFLFDSDDPADLIRSAIRAMIGREYAFEIPIVLIEAERCRLEYERLPAWWKEEMARKDVIFYTDEIAIGVLTESIGAMPLENEVVHFGELAVFWGKYDEKEYLKTAYAKLLIKQPYYRNITIRNGNTFNKLIELIESRNDHEKHPELS